MKRLQAAASRWPPLIDCRMPPNSHKRRPGASAPTCCIWGARRMPGDFQELFHAEELLLDAESFFETFAKTGLPTEMVRLRDELVQRLETQPGDAFKSLAEEIKGLVATPTAGL